MLYFLRLLGDPILAMSTKRTKVLRKEDAMARWHFGHSCPAASATCTDEQLTKILR